MDIETRVHLDIEEKAYKRALSDLMDGVMNDILPKVMKNHNEKGLELSFAISSKYCELVQKIEEKCHGEQCTVFRDTETER
jgi:hypothetical protein